MQVDPNYLVKLSSSLDQSTANEAQLTAQLSSGLRVTSLSVDPTAVGQNSLLNTEISQQDTYVQLASSEGSRLQVTDSTLGEVVTQLTSAISLAAEASNGTLNAANQTSLATELSGIRDTVLGLANTSYAGSYLFSGSQGTTQPYTLNTSTNPATATYAGDSVVQTVQTPAGQSIQVNLPGSSVFTGVLSSLNQIISDLEGSNVSATVTTDSASLTAALGQVSSQRTVLDSSLSRLQSTSSYAQTQEANLMAAESTLVASDPATIATQLSSNETQNQALLSVISTLGKTDLFDYLN